jgi:dethiobiotin synthetase
MSALVITGAGTEIGKTYVACALIAAARAHGLAVDAFKPVVSGYEDARAAESDPGLLLSALGAAVTPDAIAAIAPWRYRAPIAANLAARAEGRSIFYNDVLAACRERIASADGLLIVEGAGGLMSPLSDDHTFLDLFAALGAPVVIVGGAYLGAISHMLSALVAARSRGLKILAAIVSQGEASAGALADTRQTLAMLDRDTLYVALSRSGDLNDWGPRLAAL